MFRTAAIVLALVALPALGASQLDAVRSQAAKARESVNAVRGDQMARRAELNKLSARIETLKEQSKGKLLPGGELDGALKASQELSNQLTGLSQALAAKEGELELANLALLDALSKELGQLRAEFDRQADRNARLIIIKRLRAARAEREQVRAMLPSTKVPAMLATRPSDDPEDLLEQADLMRDRADQANRELKKVEQRIVERKEERDLDRRVNQFLGDESFFDDSDRRLRVRRETTIPAQLDAKTETTAGFANADTGGAQNKTPTTRSQVGVPYDSATDLFGNTGGTAMGAAAPQANTRDTPTAGSPPADSPPPSGELGGGADPGPQPTVKVQTGSDARPAVTKTKRIAGGEDEDLEDLEIQRAKLKGLSEELKLKAKQLEKKAAELR